MTEATRLSEIRKRYQNREPLNLSAIRVECPHLLDGLFDPANFRGWRETLETAGVAVERMIMSPLVEVECLHCGYRDANLSGHLKREHGQTAAEYRQECRAGESRSEEMRATKMGVRHGRPAKLVMPHWEPAWSELYALDRLHYCHRHGHPANRAYWTKNEPGLEGYLRRLFVHWEPVLEAIGLDPERERCAKKIVYYDDRTEICRLLRAAMERDPRSLRPVSLQSSRQAPLMRSAILVYGSLEAALEDAGIEPSSVIPEVKIPAERKKRDRLLAECRRWLREEKVRNEPAMAALLEEFDATTRAFYGSWRTLLALLGTSTKEFFQSPKIGTYRTPEEVIAALQARERAGLPMDSLTVSFDAISLRFDAEKHFGSFPKACEAAAITRRGNSFSNRRYKSPEEVIAALKRWHKTGRSLYAVDLAVNTEGRLIHKWALRYFESYPAAVRAAGFEIEERKSFSFPERVRYRDLASVVEGIHARHRAGLSLNRNIVFDMQKNGGDKGLVLAANRYYGSWDAAIFDAGYYDVDHRPERASRNRYWIKRDVIDALLLRQPTPAQPELRGASDDNGLARAIEKFFGSEREAFVAAGLLSREKAGPPPYGTRRKILDALRERADRNQPLELSVMLQGHRGNRSLAEAAHIEFGSWKAVITALEKDMAKSRKAR